MPIQNVDESNFASTIRTGVVVIEFMAEWCGPCKFMKPRLEAVSKKMPHVKFVAIDIDECKTLVKSFGLRKVPTLVVTKAGVEVARREGVTSESEVLSILQRFA